MKRWLSVLAIAAGMVAMTSRSAEAASVTFILDCNVPTATPSVCNPGGPFGSVTLTDNGLNIDVAVALTTPADGVGLVELNWLDGAITVPASATWVASGGNIGPTYTITTATNGVGPFVGRMDIRIGHSPLVNPLTFTLSNPTFGDLDVAFFNTRDGLNQIFTLVEGPKGGTDTFYGATTAVPEPASLVLLGLGLTLAVRTLRRRA